MNDFSHSLSPEPTAVGAGQFRCRGSRRESAVAQLFSLGHVSTPCTPLYENKQTDDPTFWQFGQERWRELVHFIGDVSLATAIDWLCRYSDVIRA